MRAENERTALLQVGTQHYASVLSTQDRFHDQAEQKLCSAFTDKDVPLGRFEEHPHVVLGAIDRIDQIMRHFIVAPLLVRDRSVKKRGLDYRYQCQRATSQLALTEPKHDALTAVLMAGLI